jgi:hypothetical protein
MPRSDTSVAQTVSKRFEQLNRAFKRLNEDEAALLVPRMKDLQAELESRTQRPTPFREEWPDYAEQLGLDKKRLCHLPPDPRLARLCTRELLQRCVVYPLIVSTRRGDILIGCYPFFAGTNGVDELHWQIQDRSRHAGTDPVLDTTAMLFGTFEEKEIREALSKNLHLFASE